MKLSFIVPIYGVEKYLRKCVDSLLHQDFSDYEIILVDDGSKDGCPAICDEYAAQYDKVKVFHRKNGGLSAARNSGIEIANGEYICFVDSDDYWMENVLSGLMEQIDRDSLDVLRFKWQNVRETGEGFYPYKDKNNINNFDSTVVDGLNFLNERMSDQCYAWSFILKKELCEKERFTEGLLFEDTDWTPRILVRANRVAGVETLVYNYLWRESGITLSYSQEKIRKELEDKLKLVRNLQVWNKGIWYDEMIASLMVSIVGILSGSMWKARKEYLKQIEDLNVLPLRCGRIGRRKARKIRMINISLGIFLSVLHYKNILHNTHR